MLWLHSSRLGWVEEECVFSFHGQYVFYRYEVYLETKWTASISTRLNNNIIHKGRSVTNYFVKTTFCTVNGLHLIIATTCKFWEIPPRLFHVWLIWIFFCLSAASKCFDTETSNITFADRAKNENKRHKKLT